MTLSNNHFALALRPCREGERHSVHRYDVSAQKRINSAEELLVCRWQEGPDGTVRRRWSIECERGSLPRRAGRRVRAPGARASLSALVAHCVREIDWPAFTLFALSTLWVLAISAIWVIAYLQHGLHVAA